MAATAGATSQTDIRGLALAIATYVIFFSCVTRTVEAVPGGVLPWVLDPLGCYPSWIAFAAMTFFMIPGKSILDIGLHSLLERFGSYARIDESDSKVKKLEVLEGIDMFYLGLNTFIEHMGVMHALAIPLHPLSDLASFGVLNGPLAFVCTMLLNDTLYWGFHGSLHNRSVYTYVHKHHHRQSVPFRGAYDASNEHPIEQAAGFSLFVLSMRLISMTLGLHSTTGFCCIIAWTLLNICNHFPFDSHLHMPLPYPAIPRDHQMHHRIPNCNYGSFSTLVDRAMGTYRPYKPLGADQDAKLCERVEVAPSPGSVLVLGGTLVVLGLLIETVRASAIPSLAETYVFVPSILLVIVAAAGCATCAPAAPVRAVSAKSD